MSLEAFMRGKGRLDGSGARLAYEDRWMVFSGIANRWVVYQRRQNTQKTKIIFAGDPEEALDILEQGLKMKGKSEGLVPVPGMLAGGVMEAFKTEVPCADVIDPGVALPAYWFFCQPMPGSGMNL